MDFLATQSIADAGLLDHSARERRIDDPPYEHAFGERVFPAQVALNEVVDAAQAEVVSGGGQEQEGAFRGVGLEVAGQFYQCRDASRLLGSGSEARDDRHGVVVGLEDDDFIGERRIPSANGPEDVPGRSALPQHSILKMRLDLARRTLGQESAQMHAVRLPDPVTRQVEGHGEELSLALEIHGGIRLYEDDPPGAQVSRVEPGVPSVEVHEYESALDLLAVQVVVGAVVGIDQRCGESTGGQGGGLDQIGPEAVERQGLPRRREPDAARCALERDRDVVLQDGDVVESDFRKRLLDVVSSGVGAGVTDHTGLVAGQIGERFRYARGRRDTADDLEIDLGSPWLGERQRAADQA